MFRIWSVFFCFFRVDVRVLKLLPDDLSVHHFLLMYRFMHKRQTTLHHICSRPSVSLEGLDLSNGNRSAPRLSNGTQASYVCCLLAAHNQAMSSTGRLPSELVSLVSSSFPQFYPGVCRSWNGLLVSWFCLREWKCVFCVFPIYFALGASLKHQITGWCK